MLHELPRLKTRLMPETERPPLPPPTTVEEIPAYIDRASTPSEKRLTGYLAQVAEVCGAAGPGEMPGIPEFLRRRREETTQL
jgi:hypothetical protein